MHRSIYTVLIAAVAACGGDRKAATQTPTTEQTDTAPIANEATDTEPPPRARLSDLGFADLGPMEGDFVVDPCRKAMAADQVCPCLVAGAADDGPIAAPPTCTTTWSDDTGAWSIAELENMGHYVYVLVHTEDDAHTPVAVAQWLSPRGIMDESYQTTGITTRRVNGIEIVEVLGAVESRDPEGPPDQGPPTRAVSICRYDGSAMHDCAVLDFTVVYRLDDDGTLNITAAELDQEPGLYDLAF